MNRGSISHSLIKTILDVAEEKGANRAELLQFISLEEETLADALSRVSVERVIELFQTIIERTGDHAIGLHVGESVKPGSFNALGYALMSSQNVLEAYKLQKSFGGVIADCAILSMRQEGSVCHLEFTVRDVDMELARPVNDMFMAMFWEYCQWITRVDGKLMGVDLSHSSVACDQEYLRIFGLMPNFSADNCSLFFDSKYLTAPLFQADSEMNGLMKQKAESLYLNRKSKTELNILVSKQIQKYLPEKKATLSIVAASLNMSERSMGRKLKREGYSFKSILHHVRESTALVHLNDLDYSVTSIAHELGYRDYSAFSHAFRIWTGYSPTEYREKLEKE